MTVLIVVGYVAWIAVTLWLCAQVLGLASFLTMDEQNVGTWIFAWTVAAALLTLSIYGLWALS